MSETRKRSSRVKVTCTPVAGAAAKGLMPFILRGPRAVTFLAALSGAGITGRQQGADAMIAVVQEAYASARKKWRGGPAERPPQAVSAALGRLMRKLRKARKELHE